MSCHLRPRAHQSSCGAAVSGLGGRFKGSLIHVSDAPCTAEVMRNGRYEPQNLMPAPRRDMF